MWYKFAAYNQHTYYGWTQDPAVAQTALEWLNRDREINVYSLETMDEEPNGRFRRLL